MSDSYGNGGLPPAPPAPEWWEHPPRSDRPPSVRNAVRLMLLRSAISVVAIIVLIATRDTFKRKFVQKTPTATNSDINAALTVGVVFGVVILVFYVFLAFQVYKGANWARIVTWVIAGLGILGALLSFGQPDTTPSRILGVISALLDVFVVVLLALGDSNRFFKPRPSAS